MMQNAGSCSKMRLFPEDQVPMQFEEKWAFIVPTLVKLLRQQYVSKSEWQDLFPEIHSICMWDSDAYEKIYRALSSLISNFVYTAQAEVMAHQEDQALLRAYIAAWQRFHFQYEYFPLPFRQWEQLHQPEKSSAKIPSKDHENEIVRKVSSLAVFYPVLIEPRLLSNLSSNGEVACSISGSWI